MSDQPTSAAPPTLTSILEALKGFSQQQQPGQVPQPTQQSAPSQDLQIQNENAIHQTLEGSVPQSFHHAVPRQQYPPQAQYPPQQPYPVLQQQFGQPDRNHGQVTSQIQHGAPGQAVEPNRKVIDPTTIIDWPSGLRCVMRTVAKHDQMIYDIRRMIKNQREHEEQWWAGRTALIEKQKARKEGRQQLAAVLKSVGSTSAEDSTSDSKIAAEEAEEVRTFDIKVYRAQSQMVKEFTAKLKAMGVPFFGTRSALVRIKGKGNESAGMTSDGSMDAKVADGKIDEDDLIELQRKMLDMLEDMCKD